MEPGAAAIRLAGAAAAVAGAAAVAAVAAAAAAARNRLCLWGPAVPAAAAFSLRAGPAAAAPAAAAPAAAAAAPAVEQFLGHGFH